METRNSPVMYKFKKRSYNTVLMVGLFILQLLGITLAVLYNQNLETTAIYCSYGFIILTLLSNYFLPKITKGDQTFILLINLLYSISLIMITRLDSDLVRNHVVWYILGIFVYLCSYYIMKLMYKLLKNKFYLFFAITIVTFIFTFVFGFVSGGAKNWISIGGVFTIQLSEFAKISYIFLIAAYYNDYEKFYNKKFGKYYLVFATYVFALLFFYQGELGTAILFFALLLSSIFVFEKRLLFVGFNIALAFLGVYLASLVLSHIKVRIDIWLDPWSDYNNKGYQIVQSLFAIANGGFFGTGIGLGYPQLVPVVQTDFILAAIIEEMGIFMGFSIILVYILLFYKSIKVSLQFQSRFYSSLSMSIGLLYSIQALIMFGGILKLIPLTGITTPFLSYGGSSTLSNFILLGVLQYITAKTGYNYEKYQ